MPRMKKAAAYLLTAVMIFLFCACSNDSAKPDSSATEAESTTVADTTVPDESGIDDIIENMTLEEKVGQMFFVRCPDVGADSMIESYHPGGFVLFGRDFEDKTADEVKSDISSYQSASSTPMLIAVDEEGGTVIRVSDNPNLRSEAFPSPKDVYLSGGWDAVKQTETEKAELLLSLGINVNLAPVCDVTGNEDSFMIDRSFSSDPQEVCAFVTETVTIDKEKGLGVSLKHFPGYGDNTDTHEDMSYDDKPYSDFQTVDFLPFKAGIEAGAGCVMVAHIIMACTDDTQPASLSEKVHDILRDELGFSGVIMTDDLSMSAITKYTGTDEAAVAAAKCGNDMLCCSDIEIQYPALLNAVKSGDIPEEQINASVKRILKWKQELGLLNS